MSRGESGAPVIQADGDDDDPARDHLLHPVVETLLRAADANDSHDEGTDQGAQHRTSATRQAAAADYNCPDAIGVKNLG